MGKTILKKCSCSHAYQDEKYGKGVRVHNLNKKGDSAVCTVCESKVNSGLKSEEPVKK